MTVDLLPLALAGTLVSRRYRRRYVGKRRTERNAAADYNPLRPADRHRLAPTYWADRQLHADVTDSTGLMPRIEVTA